MTRKTIRSGQLLYMEPHNLAQFKEEMINGQTDYSGKIYAIRLACKIVYGKSMHESDIQILKNTIAKYPELREEIVSIVQERYDYSLF